MSETFVITVKNRVLILDTSYLILKRDPQPDGRIGIAAAVE